MTLLLRRATYLISIWLLSVCAPPVAWADMGVQMEEEILIEGDDGGVSAPAQEIRIEESPPASSPEAGEILIETSPREDDIVVDEAPVPAATASNIMPRNLDAGIDDARLEYGNLWRSGSEADNTLYGKLAASANWRPEAAWELQLAGRIDGYHQGGGDSVSTLKADYGDSYVRYRGDDIKLTVGTQTVIWGRLDELPLSDRVSTADLTRGLLDDLEDRRRANPMVRAETFVAGGKLDLVWLVDFRAAELPDQDSVWYPINRKKGRVLGFDSKDVPPALVKNATISDNGPNGDGGFGARYTRSHGFADIGVTVARTRQSTPHFAAAGPGKIKAAYPRSWAFGTDAAIDAAGATWRAEVVYLSANPVTRKDFSRDTTPAMQWGGGVEFFPGDSDLRVNLQLIGSNLIDAPSILDRKNVYNVNGEIEKPFDRGRWRAKFGFLAGLDERDFLLNPEIAFLGWEPHELYLAVHYFDGGDQTLGGFYEDNSSVNLGWRAKF